MRTVSRSLLVLALAVVIASPLVAGDKKKKGKRKGRKGRQTSVVHLPKSIQFSGEQKEKVAALQKEFRPQLVALQKKIRGILTPEQRKARQAAFKEARAAGTKGKDLRKAIEAAVQLSADQKQQMKEVRKGMHTLRGQIQAAVRKILTPEQRTQLKSARGKGKRKGKKKKRPTAN